jgi:peroxiredoxin Q/BCP
MAVLEKGMQAPDFTLPDQDGNSVTLSEHRGKKVLVYFYPKADTPGCTKQACSVRDAQSDLSVKGVTALGISLDEPGKQKKFDKKYGLGFQLLSDTDHTVAKAYGVWKKFMGIIRSSFLIDEQGKILETWYKVKPGDTVPNALQVLEY